MKRIFQSLLALALPLAVVAQPAALKQETTLIEKTQQVYLFDRNDEIPSRTETERETIFWEDNFDDPSLWTIDNSGTPSADWVIGTEGPIGFFSVGMGAINSTSGGNFALFDSDEIGNASSIQNAWIQYNEPFDLSDEQFVAVEFESYYRNFQGACFVEASADGVTWTSFQVHPNVDVNSSTSNPEVVFQNLSSAIGGASEAHLRFRYEGGWDYAWMIDDIKLIIPQDNDLFLDRAFYTNWLVLSSAAQTLQDIETWDDHAYQSTMEYTHIPQDNVKPMNFVAIVRNNGNLTQTGITLTATVTTPSGVEEFTSAGDLTLMTDSQGVIFIDDVMLDAFSDGGELGLYEVDFVITADAEDDNPGNNVIPTKRFNVTEDVFANDNPLNNATSLLLTSNRILATRFAYSEPATVTHIRFALYTSETSTTVPGEFFHPNIRGASVIQPESGSNTTEPVFNETEMEYVIEEEMLNETVTDVMFITMPFPSPVEVDAERVWQGEILFPATAGGEQVVVLLGQNSKEDFAGVVRNFNNDPSSYGQGWFSLGSSVPLIRLVSDESVSVSGIEQLNFDMGQNYPNPTTGNTRIDWELMVPATNVQFSITDINGRTIVAKDLGDRPAGKQEAIELNLNHLAAGTYQYGITIGNERIVRKMVIMK